MSGLSQTPFFQLQIFNESNPYIFEASTQAIILVAIVYLYSAIIVIMSLMRNEDMKGDISHCRCNVSFLQIPIWTAITMATVEVSKHLGQP